MKGIMLCTMSSLSWRDVGLSTASAAGTPCITCFSSLSICGDILAATTCNKTTAPKGTHNNKHNQKHPIMHCQYKYKCKRMSDSHAAVRLTSF